MKLAGSATIAGAPEEVFERLLDAQLLARCIPGCESMQETAPGVYATRVRAGVGAVKGRFDGQVTLADIERFSGYSMSLQGKSTVGHLQGGARVRLVAEDRGTRIDYEGEAKVSGLIARVGGRLLEAAARKSAQEFFERLAAEVSAEPR